MIFMGFDIETGDCAADGDAWRPLPITCAVLHDGRQALRLYADPGQVMSKAMACNVVDSLTEAVNSGYMILTWNGVNFDFRHLAYASGMFDECKQLCEMHVDAMFHFFCEQGFPCSLQKACDAMLIKGKSPVASGADAPRMWRTGEHEKVLQYCEQDVACLVQLAQECVAKKQIRWVTGAGKVKALFMPDGFRTVRDAMARPLPDTSWMDRPMSREGITGWLRQ